MSFYGNNFGFRRSDESMAVAEGRFRTPATGTKLRLGTAVEIDPSSAGFMKASGATTTPVTGFHGFLVQEEDQILGLYDLAHRTTDDFGSAKLNTYSVIRGGAGTKVWFKNTASTTAHDGTVRAAVTMGVFSGLAVGDWLTWDGTQWIKATVTSGVPANAWFKVTALSGTTYVEAVCLF